MWANQLANFSAKEADMCAESAGDEAASNANSASDDFNARSELSPHKIGLHKRLKC